MPVRVVRALALVLSAATVATVAAPATAAAPAAADAAVPPVVTAAQWTLRVTAGSPAGFIVKVVDPDGGKVTLAWAFDDGTAASGRRVTKVWTVPGLHTARLTATDATGQQTVRDFTVEVLPPEAPVPPAPPAAVHMPRPGPAPVAHASTVTTALRLGRTGTIGVRVRCAPVADCTGTVSVARGGRRLAAAPYAVAAGRSETVVLRVPAQTARALRRRPARRVAVVLTLAPSNGAASRADTTLRIR
jgi:hypothetical protein